MKNLSINFSQQIENSVEYKNERKNSDTQASKQSTSKERFPEITPQILEEAIKQEILPPSFKDRLITNPNKYSVFFAQFDCNSPTMKQSLKNLNLNEQDAKTLSYYEFSSQTLNTLNNVISYLYYLTEHYELLRAIVNERNRLKKEKEYIKKLRARLLSEVGGDYEDTVEEWSKSNDLNRSKLSPNNSMISSQMNKSMSQLLEKSRSLKSYDQKKSISQMKYGKYDEVIGFVRNQKINNLNDQRQYENTKIPKIEKKVEDRSVKIQKEVEKKAKEQGEKLKRAQDKVKRTLERQEMLIEKKLIELDTNGEKYEEFKRKREEARQLEIQKVREIKQRKTEQIKKNRDQQQQEEIAKRSSLNQLIERRESTIDNTLKRMKSEHDSKFQALKVKYDEVINSSVQKKEITDNKSLQSICENQLKRLQKSEVREKALSQIVQSKHAENSKKLEKLQKFFDVNEYRNENKLDKMRAKIQNKFIRIDKVNEMNNQKAQELMMNNSRRHNKAQTNFAGEIYKYGQLQDKVMKKHTDIDDRKQLSSLQSSDYFILNRSLSQDLFVRREGQFDNIK